jgi:hypothetical protein
MILIWNDAKSFQRHLEDMRAFRQSHFVNPGEVPKILKDFPVQSDIKPEYEPGSLKSFTDTNGKMILVPIWEIELCRGSQN